MENTRYEEEYSLLEIAKYNLKHWYLLLICAVVVGVAAGAYGYKNTEPSVIYYEELQQVNGAFYFSQYNDSTITERMYDLQQTALSNGAYEQFLADTGYEMTYQEYTGMFGYSNDLVSSVLNLYIAFPEAYGNVTVETEEEALSLMQQLLDSQKGLYDTYMGEGAVSVLSAPYVTSYTRASADTATTKADLLQATLKGGMAGACLGLLIGILAVSAVYLVGTVAKTAKEIESRLKAPVVAYVHKKDRAEEFKKVFLYLEKDDPAGKCIAYVPYHAKNADGAYDLAKVYAAMDFKTLLVDLAADAHSGSDGFSRYLFGLAGKEAVEAERLEDNVTVIGRNAAAEGKRELLSSKVLQSFLAEKGREFDRVIVNAPDLMISSDAYGVAAFCSHVLIGCKRGEVTGTDLCKMESTLENNKLTVAGVIVYGN